MSEATTDFLFNVGETERIRARQPGLTEEAKPTRGLALRELTLKRSYEGWSSGLFHRNKENEIFFITTAFDMSGNPPQSYPEKPEDAENVWIPLAAGETYHFSLGVGMPLWGPKPLTGGLAIAIIVGESDKKSKQVGEHIKEAADAFKSDDSISAFLGKLVASPASIPADVIFGVLGKAASTAGSILANNNHEHVGLFRGLFPAKGSWEDMLEETQAGAAVKLAEVKQT
jgi:hypothetical protein